MWNIYKVVGVLAVICVLTGLFFSANSPTAVTDKPHSNAVPQTKLETTTEVQPTPAGQDPFKKFLDEKSNNPNSYVRPENAKDQYKQAKIHSKSF